MDPFMVWDFVPAKGFPRCELLCDLLYLHVLAMCHFYLTLGQGLNPNAGGKKLSPKAPSLGRYIAAGIHRQK